VKVRSLQEVICCEYKEYDQEDEDAGEVVYVSFEGHGENLNVL